MNDRFKFRMWSAHAGRYFDENNDAMLENVFECMKQQICYDCQNPVFRKIYDRIAYNHIADGMVFEQCTGLKDKNGKLIYEGDILKITDQGIDYIVEVYWCKGMFCYDITPNGANLVFCDLTDNETTCEIIGNIHSNADLIKVGGK